MMRQWIGLLTAVALLWGCASAPQPFAYHEDRDEKPGPGLFSGDRGGYVIYGEPPDHETEEEKAPEASDPQ